ncbi:unnamed protein product [Brassicogethes aeneus]|uniref:UDP-glucuronosyltransferase n=1 Tax=Brassicogethes aeneus TaxID=1431903 RepID=A0A9P0FC55_BRAAE|nr:unnamed protein product [Brassicogethes aeneus]
MFYRPLWRELSLRGHQVTIITTDPMNDTSLTNLTEINTHVTYEALARHNILDAAAEASLGAAVSLLGGLLQDLTKTHFNVPEVRKLINSDAEFDLVMFETQIFAAPIVYSWRFKCPSIGVTSFDAAMEYHYNLGNLVHPVVNPDFNLYVKNTSHMSYFERVKSTVYSVLLNYYMYNYYYPIQEDVLRGFFGSTMPSLWEMTKNVSMLFIGTHPVLHDVRPINPHTITLSTIYLKPKKPLPTSIQQYLEESQNGVIYFSLGTNVKDNVFNSEKKNAILEAFAELPYNVLMKAHWVNIRIPKNVRMEKWLPQHDILRHKNVKLFITQGGINSLTESLSSGVPVLIIPFFGDQLTNTQKAIKMGYGLKLDKNLITTENVKEKVTTLIKNPKYRERANELGKILLDQPIRIV